MQSLQANPREISYLSGRTTAIIIDAMFNFYEFFSTTIPHKFDSLVEVCMGMGKTRIPWVPWDSHGNGCKISHGMEMGWEWELSAWEWEFKTWELSPATANSLLFLHSSIE